jgi:hypothetical protein
VRLRDRGAWLGIRLLALVVQPLMRRLTIGRGHRGFRIMSTLDASQGRNELAFARVRLALDLIAACDPRRFARIRRDMPGIQLIPDGGGLYSPIANSCMVDWQAVMWHPVPVLAQTIVHEATHARLHRARVGHPVAWKERIERRCVREEVAFARRVPDGGAWAASLEAAMEERLATRWWLPHAAIEREIRYARAVRFSSRYVRWLERRRARLAAKARNEPGTGS